MIKNSLGRMILKPFIPYDKPDSLIQKNPRFMKEVYTTNTNKLVKSLSEVFDNINIKDGMTLGFHHHLRNGDYVLNMVAEEIKKRNLKDITIAASGIFPVHEPLVSLIKNENIAMIYSNYMNGAVAKAVSKGYLKHPAILDTHGGRARAIETGELIIDVAFIAVPTSDKNGNGTGAFGPSACGSLGYAMSDMKYAKNKVVITDNLVNEVPRIEIEAKYIDYVLKVDKIGDQDGIFSGTTRPTKDPVQLKIARNTATLIKDLDLIKEGFSMQTGAGATSLAVAGAIRSLMVQNKVIGSFASGGITAYLVDMLNNHLFENLYDVQCFDNVAIESYRTNPKHLPLTASSYASVYGNPIVNKLDVVILGATEIDKDFNCNVTTDSNNIIIGGSGGHSDAAYGAKITIITTNLIKSRLPIIKKEITTVTTPGESIDVIVTERGIAINPLRKDLIEKLKDSKLTFKTIDELIEIAEKITHKPEPLKKGGKVVALVRYRDGSFIDSIYQNITDNE
ncbi:MAG: citrate lyase subunit alpha [Acholeplasmataceae bacterium]|jgi:citrate lyase subunit alpha/citrate CoA-transferase